MTETLPPIVSYPTLLPHLHALVDSGDLRELWADETAWIESAHVTYQSLRVEWLAANYSSQVNTTPLRVRLLRLPPCDPSKHLWHGYPTPRAVQLLDGACEYASGYLDHGGRLRRASTVMLHSGSSFEAADPTAWHYLRPREMTYAVSVCPARRMSEHATPEGPQRALSEDESEDLRLSFGDLLAWS